MSVFAGLALRLRNRSSIGYESWSQIHAFMKTCLVSSVILGKSIALMVTREEGFAYLFSFVQDDHYL